MWRSSAGLWVMSTPVWTYIIKDQLSLLFIKSITRNLHIRPYMSISCERLYIFMREHLTFRTVTQTPGQWFGFMPLGEGTRGPVDLYGYLKGFRNDTRKCLSCVIEFSQLFCKKVWSRQISIWSALYTILLNSPKISEFFSPDAIKWGV